MEGCGGYFCSVENDIYFVYFRIKVCIIEWYLVFILFDIMGMIFGLGCIIGRVKIVKCLLCVSDFVLF